MPAYNKAKVLAWAGNPSLRLQKIEARSVPWTKKDAWDHPNVWSLKPFSRADTPIRSKTESLTNTFCSMTFFPNWVGSKTIPLKNRLVLADVFQRNDVKELLRCLQIGFQTQLSQAVHLRQVPRWLRVTASFESSDMMWCVLSGKCETTTFFRRFG